MFNIRRAAADGGIVLALIASIAALAVAYVGANPAEPVAEEVLAPIARSVGILPSVCPSGWQDTSADDEHALIKSCQKGNWLVVLDQQGKFNHALQLDTPGATFVFNEADVPEWNR